MSSYGTSIPSATRTRRSLKKGRSSFNPIRLLHFAPYRRLDGDHQIEFATLEHLGCHRVVLDDLQHYPVQIRLLPPVVFVAHQGDRPVRLPSREPEGPGAI